MRARGHVSDTARSGVDVPALADAAGMATPRPGVLQRIAEWLGVAPAVLVWGRGADEAPAIEQETLQLCIQAVLQAQAGLGTTVVPEVAARVVSILYLEAMDGRPPAPDTVTRILLEMA